MVAYEMIYGERPFKIHCPIDLIRCVDTAFYLHESRRKGVPTVAKASGETLSGKMPVSVQEDVGSVGSAHNVEESVIRMSKMRMMDVDDQLSNTDDRMNDGGRQNEDASMSPESHWDFDFVEDDKFSNELKVLLPEMSPVLGQVSQEAYELMRGLLDIRPSMRLGSRMCPHKIQEAPLLVKWKVNDEKTLLAKQIRPSFVPGRKFLLFGADPNSGGSDPYSAAVGKGVSADDLSLSAEDQAKFDGFCYLSGSALPL